MSGQPISGPYWLHHTPTELQIKGRNGAIAYRYSSGQAAMADAQLRQLQKRHFAALEAMRAAAPELFEALFVLLDRVDLMDMDSTEVAHFASAQSRARAALSKATGAPS